MKYFDELIQPALEQLVFINPKKQIVQVDQFGEHPENFHRELLKAREACFIYLDASGKIVLQDEDTK